MREIYFSRRIVKKNGKIIITLERGYDMDYLDRLFELGEEDYAKFQSGIMPGVDFKTIIGVRVPIVRKLAREMLKNGDYEEFIKELPHKYYDENMLHGIIISEIKDHKECIKLLDEFLPFVDNWAVCDIMSPKCFIKNKEKLLKKIYEWVESSHEYTCRFGLEMLMSHFLGDGFRPEFLDIPLKVKLEGYYVRMMIAWFFATALTKRWDATVSYIEEGVLPLWVHNKTISKACESRLISEENKEYLRRFKKKLR